MKTTDDNIKKIFQEKFDSDSPNIEIDEFDKIQLKVSSKKFYKFQYTTFNIFYAIAIASTFIASLAVTTDYIRTKNLTQNRLEVLEEKVSSWNKQSRTQQQNAAIIKTTEEEIKKNGLPKATETQIKKVEKALKPVEIPTQKIKQVGETKISDAPVSNKPINNYPDTLATPKSNVEAKKTVVYIVKRDTIIKYDSVKVYKRNKK